ncbi:MAG: peptidylprolyl isomerase [Gallionellaceae bacterium]|nr:peptidylprolyl isomerase [Gallionellaceae bacterium]MDD5365910.1 peptidylprolyl isomerase [Gallionellaceae bacterium]
MLKSLLLACVLLAANFAQAGNPTVEIRTSLGAFSLELYPDKAPETVKNFLGYVKTGFYDGTVFHRVIDGFMIQGGGFDTRFNQKETRAPVRNEADNGLKNTPYTVAMARTGDPHSATAQFFVNVADNAFLNFRSPDVQGYGYTVFGKVVKGKDVVAKIASQQTGPGGPFESDVPRTAVVIKQVTVVAAP